jgi:hypothetical protein
MARKRTTAKATAKKKAAALPTIEIDVDLGSLASTEEQKARLRAYLDSVLLTWLKYDLKEKTECPTVIIDHHGPPNI